MESTRPLVWDLPVRIFHWLFASGYLVAFAIARLSGEGSRGFSYHALIGLGLAVLVGFRLVWLFVGTRWSRLSGLDLNPAHLLRYLSGVLRNEPQEFFGHNPATSWTLLGMLAGVAGLAWTGLEIGRGSEGAEDIHGLLANGVLVLAGLHVMGVLLHSLRQCDGLALTMIHGRKASNGSPSVPARPIVAAIVFASIGVWFAAMVATFNPMDGSVQIPVVGAKIALDGHQREVPEISTEGRSADELEDSD